MAYIAKILTKTEEVIVNLQGNMSPAAQTSFNELLDLLVQNLSMPFDSVQWNTDWRVKVWSLGLLMKNVNYPRVQFIQSVDAKKQNSGSAAHEILDFIKSELHIAVYVPEENIEFLKSLIGKYPANPEFRHSLGVMYGCSGEKKLSLEAHEIASGLEPTNNKLGFDCYNALFNYVNEHIQQGKFDEAEKLLEKMDNYPDFSGGYVFKNLRVQTRSRITDHRLLLEKIKELDHENMESVRTELEGERKRIIEIIGIFSAILAFILTSVSIASKFSLREAVFFQTGLGLVLIIFAVVMSLLFTRTLRLWKLKIGLIAGSVLGLLVLFMLSQDETVKSNDVDVQQSRVDSVVNSEVGINVTIDTSPNGDSIK